MRDPFRLVSRCLVLAGVLLGLLAEQGAQAAPGRWSAERLMFAVDGKAAVTDSPARSSSFLPGIALSYSLVPSLSIAATAERDFSGALTIGKVGVRFPIARLSDGDGRLAAAVGVVAYGDEGAAGIVDATSWDAGLHGSWALAEDEGVRVLWGIASAVYDSENTRTTYRLGLRYRVMGGRE